MKLQESGEMYLETILMLSKKTDAVRSIDICAEMNFSKPSVSRAMKLLREGDYITMDKNGYITLTDAGLEIAETILERHEVLTKMFVDLGVPEDIAVEDACKIEHDISPESFDAIKEHLRSENKL